MRIENCTILGDASGPNIGSGADDKGFISNGLIVPRSWYASADKPIGDKELVLHTLFWLTAGLCLGVGLGHNLPGAWAPWVAWTLWATLIPVAWLAKRARRRGV